MEFQQCAWLKISFFTSFLSILEYIFVDNLNINLPIAVLLGKRLSLYDLPETSYKTITEFKPHAQPKISFWLITFFLNILEYMFVNKLYINLPIVVLLTQNRISTTFLCQFMQIQTHSKVQKRVWPAIPKHKS